MDALTEARISPWLSRSHPDLALHLFHFARAEVGVGHPGLDPLRAALRARLRRRAEAAPLESWPELNAVRALIGAAGGSGALEDCIRRILTGGAFPVENDATDLGAILGAWFLRPAWAIDSACLEGPLELVAGDGPGPLAIADRRGTLVELERGPLRARLGRGRRGILVAVIDPGLPSALDAAIFLRRARNWIESLTRGTLVSHRSAGGRFSA